MVWYGSQCGSQLYSKIVVLCVLYIVSFYCIFLLYDSALLFQLGFDFVDYIEVASRSRQSRVANRPEFFSRYSG